MNASLLKSFLKKGKLTNPNYIASYPHKKSQALKSSIFTLAFFFFWEEALKREKMSKGRKIDDNDFESKKKMTKKNIYLQ